MAAKPIAPQAQESNYATVFNINFRPPHKPLATGANVKLKCPSCGVWGRKGTTCRVCRMPIPGPRRIYIPPSPPAGGRAAHISASGAASSVSSPQKAAGGGPRQGVTGVGGTQ